MNSTKSYTKNVDDLKYKESQSKFWMLLIMVYILLISPVFFHLMDVHENFNLSQKSQENNLNKATSLMNKKMKSITHVVSQNCIILKQLYTFKKNFLI